MPYKRFLDLDPIKKQSILEKSLEAFAKSSFKVASINNISKEAGLSAGALYYYFEDKKDLFYTTLDYITEELSHNISDLVADFEQMGYWEGITEIVQKRVSFTLENPLFMELFHRILLSDDEVESEGRKRLLSTFVEIFDYGYSHGYIRTDLPRSLLFDLHLNMTLTINQWTLSELKKDQGMNIDLDELYRISASGVKMIRHALSR